MTGTAIAFMALAMVLVWGGLALAIVRLRKEGGYDDEAPHDL